MKLNKMLKLMGLLGAFSLAVGCAGPAEKAEEPKMAKPEMAKPDAAKPEATKPINPLA